jgi:hypothetical protein
MSVIFDQLRISDDGKRMYINVHVNTAPDFDNVYLDSIKIVPADRVLETDPNTPSSDYIYYKQFEGNQKVSGLVVSAVDFNETWETPSINPCSPCSPCKCKAELSNTLFFVYVKTKGTPGPCVPCRLDEEYTLGVVFDENLLYQRVMGYTRELVEDCNIPQGFIDFILLWNAFKAAIETEHFIPAVKYYNMLFDGSAPAFSSSVKGGCGCRG